MPSLATVNAVPAFDLRNSAQLGDAVSDLAWLADGREAAVGSADGMLHRLDSDGRLLHSWQGHTGGVTRVCPQPGERRRLASAGEDGRVVLWRTDGPTAEATLSDESDWIEHLAWTPDGRVLAAAARKTISLWRGSEPLGMWYDARRHVLGMDWAPDSRRLATAANKGLYLWRLGEKACSNTEPVELLSFPGAPVAVAWQPNGRALALGTQDGFLQIWQPGGASSKAKQLTMRGYPSKVNCLAWHPRRPRLATAGGPDIVLWDLPGNQGGARGKPLRHHQSTVTAVDWADDGSLLASADRSGRLCIWDGQGDLIFTHKFFDEISVLQWQPGHAALIAGDTAGGLHTILRHPDRNPLKPDEEANRD